MEIEEVLKGTDKAIPIYQEKNRFSNVYASLDDGGVLWWHSMESDKRLEPVPLSAINEKEWGSYHEAKEIRPESIEEVWRSDKSNSLYVTDAGHDNELFFRRHNGSMYLFHNLDHAPIHGKNWKRLIPSVEDDSVETIEIEGVKWKRKEIHNEIYFYPDLVNSKSSMSYQGHYELTCKSPMKMILEIPKV